jgi:lysophospholipase L1-like esterase
MKVADLRPFLIAVLAAAGLNGLTDRCALAGESELHGARLVGRFLATGTEATFEWPGTAIEVEFQGAWLDVVLDDTGRNSMVVDVDGSVSRLDLKKGEHTYRVLSDTVAARHAVRLVRRTEASFGATVLKDIRTDGSFLPPQPKTRSFLVIGDSISAGYGVEGKDAKCRFSADTENQYLTFAAVVARRFGADVTTLAASGKGLVRNYDGSTTATMSDLYTRLLPSRPDREQLPDTSVIVVHLGSNDFSSGARPPDFVARYADLLAQLRANAPDAMIYAGIGPMLWGADLDAAVSAVNEAVAVRRAAGERKIAPIKFDSPQGVASRGCDSHPNEIGQGHMADELEARVKADLGWEETK